MGEAIMEGVHVYLRALRLSDVKMNYYQWLNDPEVCKYNRHAVIPQTYDSSLKYYESINVLGRFPETIVFAIVEISTDKHIGNLNIQKISWIDRNAELSILIGDKQVWGKGYGKEAWKLAIEYAFEKLNLHRVYCGTHAENRGMIQIAKANGMTEEGRFKDGIFKNGEYVTVIYFGLLNPNHC